MPEYLSTDPNAGAYLSTDPHAGLEEPKYLSTDPNAAEDTATDLGVQAPPQGTPVLRAKGGWYGTIGGEFHHDANFGPYGNPLGPKDVALSLDYQQVYPIGSLIMANGKGPYRVADSSFTSPGKPNTATIEFRDTTEPPDSVEITPYDGRPVVPLEAQPSTVAQAPEQTQPQGNVAPAMPNAAAGLTPQQPAPASLPFLPRSGMQMDNEEARQAEQQGPVVPIPKAEISQSDPIPLKAAKAGYNAVSGFIEGVESPAGTMAMLNPFMGLATLGQMVPDLIHKVKTADKTPPNSPERWNVGAEVVGFLSLPAVIHAASKLGATEHTSLTEPTLTTERNNSNVNQGQGNQGNTQGVSASGGTGSGTERTQTGARPTAGAGESSQGRGRSGQGSPGETQRGSGGETPPDRRSPGNSPGPEPAAGIPADRGTPAQADQLASGQPAVVQSAPATFDPVAGAAKAIHEINRRISELEQDPNPLRAYQNEKEISRLEKQKEEIRQKLDTRRASENGQTVEVPIGSDGVAKVSAPVARFVNEYGYGRSHLNRYLIDAWKAKELGNENGVRKALSGLGDDLRSLGVEDYAEHVDRLSRFFDEEWSPSRVPAAGVADDLVQATAESTQGTVAEHGMRLRAKVDEGAFITPPTLAEIGEFGQRLYQKGITYAKWAADMVYHLGEKVKVFLRKIWDSLTGQNILPHARESGSIGGGNLRTAFSGKLRKIDDLDRATMGRSQKLQRSTDDARRASREFQKAADEKQRNAIAVFREAAGDPVVLQQWEQAAKGKLFKQAAKDAQSLTPQEKALAQRTANIFSILAQRGQKYDVLKSFRDEYIPHVFDLNKGPGRPGGGGARLQQTFRHARLGKFKTFFEADQAGYIPKTLDVGKLVPHYLASMNRVIADRQFVQDMVGGRAADGRPLVEARGAVKVTVDPATGDRAYLTTPDARQYIKDPTTGERIDTGDYKMMTEQPALHQWLWRNKDEQGNPILQKADLYLHPEAYMRLKAMLGDGARPNLYDKISGAMKREMFSFLAPFHQVQEGTHAIGHTVNPFFGLKKIDFRDPAVRDAAQYTLLNPERPGDYLEGVGSHGSLLTKGMQKVPGLRKLGEVADAYQDYLFNSYIPRLKYTTYDHILNRNMKRFAKELADGTYTPEDIKLLSGQQTDAAYGHLNKALNDRSPEFQRTLQRVALAPDFLEARAKFVGQSFKGLYSKAGREQLRAFAVLAGVQAGTAIILANLIPGGHWDPKDPFSVQVNNRKYTMRSVPEDLLRLVGEGYHLATGESYGSEFISARVNPLLQSMVQLIWGRNYRGEKVTASETFLQAAGKFIPLTLRQIPGLRWLTEPGHNNTVSPLEQLWGSFGLKVSRASPINDIYGMAGKWADEHGLPRDTGSYPVSKYQQLRYALEDQDFEKARIEYDRLIADRVQQGELVGHASRKIQDGFKESLSHPFTGKNQETDKMFAKSLSAEDKQLYDLAVQRRKQIYQSFRRLRYNIMTGQ